MPVGSELHVYQTTCNSLDMWAANRGAASGECPSQVDKRASLTGWYKASDRIDSNHTVPWWPDGPLSMQVVLWLSA